MWNKTWIELICEIVQIFHNFCPKYMPPLSEFSHCFCPTFPLLLPEFPIAFSRISGRAMGNSGKSNGKILAKAMRKLGKRRHIYFGQKSLLLPEFPIAFAHCFFHCFCPNFSFFIFLGAQCPPPPPPPPPLPPASYTPMTTLQSLNAKTDISIFINLRYLRLKLLKNKENNKKVCHIFHHNFKNIPCYVMSEVSLKMFYFALFDDGLAWKTLKLAFPCICFCIQTLPCVN